MSSLDAHDGLRARLQAEVEARRDRRLDDLLEREIVSAGVAQSAAVAWARRTDRWRISYGEMCPAVDDPLFDLASVTKPLTATVVGALVADGRISLRTRVVEVLPELAGAALADATVEALLGHRAGAPAWGALYRDDPWASSDPRSLPPDAPLRAEDAPRIKAAILARAASRREPSGSSVYSDVGYVLLGEMCARVLGGRLRDAWPIGAHRNFDARVQPTEQSAFRGVVRGVVHDENAWALESVGGDPGHAGAFGDALQLARFAISWADAVAGRAGILPTELARAMVAERPGGSHRLGWDGRSGDAPSSGAHFGPRTFGHLGFTGTSVWIDPDAEVIAVLLTNRTWPTRANVRIRAARPRVHDALFTLDR